MRIKKRTKIMIVHRFGALQQTGALNDFEAVDNFIYLEYTINNNGQLWKGKTCLSKVIKKSFLQCLCFPYFFIALKHGPYMYPTRYLQSEVLDVLHTTNSPRYKCIYTKWIKITRHFNVSSLFYFCINISLRLREPWKTDCIRKKGLETWSGWIKFSNTQNNQFWIIETI